MSYLKHRGPGRTTLAALAASALLIGGMAAATPASADPSAGRPNAGADAPAVKDKPGKLGSEDQQLITEATTAGKRSVTVMVIAAKGQTAQAKADVRALGGSIRYAADKYSYFSAHVPVQKVEKAAASKNIRAISVDRVIAMPEPDAGAGRGGNAGGNGPNKGTPDDNPYMPTNETGAVAFKSAHPTWDGKRRHDRHPRLGRRPRAPGAAEDQHGAAQDRRLVHCHRPGLRGLPRRRGRTWLPMLTTAARFPAPVRVPGSTGSRRTARSRFSTLHEAEHERARR